MHNKNLDKLDLKIMKSLNEDCSKSITQIAKEVGTSRPTVIARIKRLKKEQIIDFGAKINVAKLGFKFASIHLEANDEQSTEQLINTVRKCPRVLQLFQITSKPIYLALVYTENAETLLSTIDCLSSVLNAKVTSYQRVIPVLGESFSIKINIEKCDVTPCGKECGLCLSYKQNECVGCPSVKEYKGPI